MMLTILMMVMMMMIMMMMMMSSCRMPIFLATFTSSGEIIIDL